MVAEGDWWTDDYAVKPVGILEVPGVMVKYKLVELELPFVFVRMCRV